MKDSHLIVEYHKGIGMVQDAVDFRTVQATDPEFSPDFDIIIDLHDLIFDVEVTDLKEFVDFYLRNLYLMGHRKIAMITETPNQVVATTLFKQMHENLPQSIKVVSTVSAAVVWVNSELTELRVTTILKDLKDKAV